MRLEVRICQDWLEWERDSQLSVFGCLHSSMDIEKNGLIVHSRDYYKRRVKVEISSLSFELTMVAETHATTIYKRAC